MVGVAQQEGRTHNILQEVRMILMAGEGDSTSVRFTK